MCWTVSLRVPWQGLTTVVNPDRIAGKVTLIGRYGAGKVDQYLPGHIDAVKATNHVVVWQCDAMVSGTTHEAEHDTNDSTASGSTETSIGTAH